MMRGVFMENLSLFGILIAVNIISYILATFVSSRLRMSLSHITTVYDNLLTNLATKNSVKILVNFIWIILLFVSQMFSTWVYTLLISLMSLFAFVSFFSFISYCLPGKREQVLQEACLLSNTGYIYLLIVLFLLFLNRFLLFLIARGTF